MISLLLNYISNFVKSKKNKPNIYIFLTDDFKLPFYQKVGQSYVNGLLDGSILLKLLKKKFASWMNTALTSTKQICIYYIPL